MENFIKKFFASTLLASIFTTLLISGFVNTAFAAAPFPNTDNATNITLDNATLNGTVTATSSTQSFWVSLSGPIDTSIPVMPMGVYSTPVLPGLNAGENFSSDLSIVTTNGVPGNMPSITPGTTYYYVAWSNVAGAWYPSTTKNFTTLKLSQTIDFNFASTTINYGDSPFIVSTATTTSNLPIALSSATTQVCMVSGFTVTIAGAGTCTLNADQAGNSTYDAAIQVSQSFTVGKKDITISGGTFANLNKVYDGTTSGSLISVPTLVTFSGVINSDDSTQTKLDVDVTNAIGTIASRNASTTGTVITFAGYTLTGTKAVNYNLTNQPANATQIVNKANIEVTPSNFFSKIYDGNTTSTGTPTVTAGTIFAGDIANFSQSYLTKTAGMGKTINASGTINDGNSGNNYAITFSPRNNADIIKKTLTVLGLTASNKVYDSNIAAVTTGMPALFAVIATDTVTVGGSIISNFSDALAGTGKIVNVTGLTIAGVDANNYSLVQPTLSADITKKDLNISGLSIANKIYDKLTTAIISGTASLVGVINTDIFEVRLGGSPVANFDTKNASTSKLVTITGYNASGTAFVNYNLIAPTSTANITKRDLNILSASGTDKEYDGSRYGFVTFTDDRLSGDLFDYASTTSNFADKNADNTKSITVSGITATGTDADNYNLLTTSASTPFNVKVTKKAITITAENKTKAYGTVDPILTATATNLIVGDTLTGALVRVSGETVASSTYDITQGSLSAGDNYTTTFATGTFTITKSGQSITVNTIGNKNPNDASFNIVATTTSNLPLTYSLGTGINVCTIATTTLTLAGATGTCNFFVSQAGDSNYEATTTATIIVNVIDTIAPIITINGSDNISLSIGSNYTELGAASYDFMSGTTTAVVSGDIVNTNIAGTYTIKYNATDASNNIATEKIRTVTVYNNPGLISAGGFGGGSFILNTNNQNSGNNLQVLGTSKFKFNNNLRLGMRNNNDVKELKKLLNSLNLYKSTSTDGTFDRELFAAVKAYQVANKIAPISGFFGPKTRSIINR